MLTYENGVKTLRQMRFNRWESYLVKDLIKHWYVEGGVTESTYHKLMAYVCEYFERVGK